MKNILHRDYYIIIDASGSMNTLEEDYGEGVSRWMYMKDNLITIVNKVVKLDPDGISVYVFSDAFKAYHNVNSKAVIEKIYRENEPHGGTNLAPVIKDFRDNYSKQPKTNKSGATLFVITDGAAQDQYQVIHEIAETANLAASKEEIGITFIQIGHDSSATRFLKFIDDELDKNLTSKDIVKTIPVHDMQRRALSDILLEAISKHKEWHF